MSDHHEARLLLAILGGRRDEVERLLPESDPATFVGLAKECDVHAWVHARLVEQNRLDILGPEAGAELDALRKKCRVDNLLLIARLGQALGVLQEAGVVPVALKGVDVIHRFAVGFDERTLDDVDLLVRPEEFRRSVEALEAAGWTGPPEPERSHWLRSSFELPLTSPGEVGVTFEVHWSLGQRRRYRVDVDDLFDRTVALDVSGHEIRRLDDHDFVAHLLIHHHQHYYDRRLKWALDLAQVTASPGFSWNAVASRLEGWGGRVAAGMSAVHLHKLFPEWIPPALLSELPIAAWRRLAARPLLSDHPLDLFRDTRRRRVQLYLAAVLHERPFALPFYLLHRKLRDRGRTPSALER